VKASFLICGHNSRADLLERVVAACVAQEGLREEDDILLVDSGSSPPLQVPAAYAGRVKLVREEQPGLARARVCGIRRSSGEMLVFVDDDTVLYPDYLAQARRILMERPYLAAIGGQLIPEFEGPLPLPEHYYRERLAIREFQTDQWSNRWDDFATSPIGGGMVVRRVVADEWANLCETTPWRLSLGRTGGNLSGGEDIDLVRTVCQAGYGKGIFAGLKLTHIFPPQRLTPEFLVRITEGNRRSGVVLRAMFDPTLQPPPDTWAGRVKLFLECLGKPKLDRQLRYAEQRGRRLGWRQTREARKRHHRFTDPAAWSWTFRAWRSFIRRLNEFTWANLAYNAWGDRVANTVKFVEQHNRLPRRKMRFNDYLFSIKLAAHKDPLRVFISDKVNLRDFVSSRVGETFNVPHYAVLQTKEEVRSYNFPPRCCIKPTHLTGQVVIRLMNEPLDLEKICRWFDSNLYQLSRECYYRDLQPRVIVEQLVFGAENPLDYRFFCWKGQPRFILVDVFHLHKETHRRCFYDVAWNRLPISLYWPDYEGELPRPDNLEQMLSVASRLAVGFDLVRVDLYSDGKEIKVGEVTNCHSGASQRFGSREQEDLASRILFSETQPAATTRG